MGIDVQLKIELILTELNLEKKTAVLPAVKGENSVLYKKEGLLILTCNKKISIFSMNIWDCGGTEVFRDR